MKPTPVTRCAMRIIRSSWNDRAFRNRLSACRSNPRAEPTSRKLGDALTKLRRQDPTFRTKYDEETGETVIAGMGELHLEILKMRLTRDYKVDVVVGKPKVAYKEAITKKAEARGTHKKQSGGRGQFGDCTIRVRAVRWTKR